MFTIEPLEAVPVAYANCFLALCVGEHCGLRKLETRERHHFGASEWPKVNAKMCEASHFRDADPPERTGGLGVYIVYLSIVTVCVNSKNTVLR